MKKENVRKIKVSDLLRKYNLNTKQVYNILYHLNIGGCDSDLLVYSILKQSNLSEEELAKTIYDLILKCDDSTVDYDKNLDEEITRFGTRASAFNGGHCHNKWNNGMFEDDGFGFGTEPTSLYDDYVDSNFEGKRR